MIILEENKIYYLMLPYSQSEHLVPSRLAPCNQRQYFNYLRNDSSDIFNVMEWKDPQVRIDNQSFNCQPVSKQKDQNQSNPERKTEKRVTFEQEQKKEEEKVKKQQSLNKDKKIPQSKNVLHETHKRPRSAANPNSMYKRNVQQEEQKKIENQKKVQNYIAQLKPYSRNLSNTKFQEYFQKPAPQCYGRANTNQPIGGLVYGNHLKTFNMNPHSYTNKPEYYQTHKTAINYGKRTKLNEEGKWRRLQKELTKKLGLKDKNQTIKEGKQVVYVDVDDSNMYQVMKQNNQFAKAHREEIRDLELQYKKDKHQAYLEDINQFYAKKQDKISQKLRNKQHKQQQSTLDQEQEERKLNQQVIYRYHDENGQVRLAADRHAITNFVDLNFPQNDSVYTEELKKRMPIFPQKVKYKDQEIDELRRENYEQSKQDIYPSHYLVRNCDQPEVVKMQSKRVGVQMRKASTENKKSVRSNSAMKKVPKAGDMNKSTADRTNFMNQTNGKQQREEFSMSEQTMKQRKADIMNQAWKSPEVAAQIEKKMNSTSCTRQHLPQNQLNPRCYQNVSQQISKIPFAG